MTSHLEDGPRRRRLGRSHNPRGTLDLVSGPEIVTTGPPDRAAIGRLDDAVRDATGHPALGDAVWRDLDHPAPDSVGLIARDGKIMDKIIGLRGKAEIEDAIKKALKTQPAASTAAAKNSLPE